MPEQAKRLADTFKNSLPGGLVTDEIQYWKAGEVWWIYLPRGGAGRLTNHEVTEHDDGTITVKGSILRKGAGGTRHGYLERGIWREV